MRLNPAALETLRIYAGLSQAELARRSGLSQGHISEIERTDKNPRPKTIKKLADALSVPMPSLLYEPGPNGTGPSRGAGGRSNGASRRTNGTGGTHRDAVKACPPGVGDSVLFRPDPANGTVDGTVVPAVVLRTRDTSAAATAHKPTTSTNQPDTRPAPDRSTPRPPDLVMVLPNDWTVDLVVFGLVQSHRAYRVPHGQDPGCWCWPTEHTTMSPRRSSGNQRREPLR